MRVQKEFALYKGEELLSIGTFEEIAEEMGVKKKTIMFYHTPAYKKRLETLKKARVLIELESDEECGYATSN